jgi:diguanylate cyclase (GGDEF)-like protein
MEAIHGVSSYGLVRLGNLIYMVATEPVRPTSSKTKIVGTLTFAKQVDSGILTSMAKMTPCGLALYVDGVCNAVDSGTSTRNELPAAPEEGYAESLPRAKTIVRASSDGSRVFAWQALNDWNGRDIAVLMTSSSATQTLASRRDIFVRSLILTASCLLASLLAALQMRAARLAQRAHIDELTGLPNHRYLQERLAQEVVRARRYGRDFAVAMLDIDHFKHINDEYGHQVGDQALRQLADVLRTTLRDTDVVARYGGEEFLVIMPETDLPSAMAFGERARKAVDETTFDVRLNGSAGRRASRMKFHFTVSVGVAKYPDHAERADELIMAADLALFAAKHASRNAVRSYEAIANEQARKVRNPLTIHLAMREGSLAAVRALAAAVDARDHTMRGHSEKVALYSLAIGQSLDLHEDEMNTLRTAALLHDVGRIAVPDRILWKRGELSEEERAVVMTHSATGSEILSKAPQLAQVAEVVRSHHERYDGAGYPDGLSGGNIPLLSRIICVADSFDAMTSDRSYKQAVTAREAVMQMRKQSGLQFDPQMVDIMDHLVSSGELFRMLGSSWDEPARAA